MCGGCSSNVPAEIMVTVLNSPGDVQPPQQHQQLDSQVQHEPAVVPLTNTVLYPGAVMVVTSHAVLTRLAVLRPHWLLLGTNIIVFRGNIGLKITHSCVKRNCYSYTV